MAGKPDTGPWDVEGLKRTPPLEWLETEYVVCPLLYGGEPYRGEPTRVFAYYAAPKNIEGKVPGMVLVHGGGGKAFKEWAHMWEQRGYAAIAMDLAGKGRHGETLPDGGPDQGGEQKFADIADGVENAWPYHAVAAVLRGASVLAAQPEVDENRIGITGISWGGYLTCIAAGLDDRLRLAVPVYGCGFLHEGTCFVEMLAQLGERERGLWIENFDPSRYLPGADLPMLWVNGTNDFAYWLGAYRRSYRAQAGPHTLCVQVGMNHGHEPGWAREEIEIFADQHLRDGTPLPEMGRVKVRRGRARAKFKSETEVASAALHCTFHECPWPERDWVSRPADVERGRIRAEMPEREPTACFMTLTDERGVTVSTEHLETGEF